MCYVIVTSRTLLWTLLSVATTLTMLAAVVTPTWLVGMPKKPLIRGRVPQAPLYRPSIGIYNRCVKLHQIDELFTDNCAPFVTSMAMPSEEFPTLWKAALLLFGCGVALMSATCIAALLGCCVRSVGRKSIFTVSGTVQAIAGLMFLLGLLLYPAGWGSRRVHTICGPNSEPFMLGGCTLGWALYLAIGATLTTFLCSVLSIQAEISTSSDKVQDEILRGKNLICLI